jgi:hypothetical protein
MTTFPRFIFVTNILLLTCSLMDTRLLLSQGRGEGVEDEAAARASRDLTRSLDRMVIWNPLQKRRYIIDEIALMDISL